MAVKSYQKVLENVQNSRKSQWFLNEMKIDWQPCINLIFFRSILIYFQSKYIPQMLLNS